MRGSSFHPVPEGSSVSIAGFEVGRIYNRRQDIHARFGGQRYGGIATPARFPVIFGFSGEAGIKHGYADGWTADGVFRYFGEGQEGDMRLAAGNKAIADHAADGKDLLLFQTLCAGRVRFLGAFGCTGYEVQQAPDRHGVPRNAIVFSFVSGSSQSGEGSVSDGELQIPPQLSLNE